MATILAAVAFLVFSMMVGVWVSRWVRSGSDFLVAGREVGALVQFCSFASIPFAASFSVAVPQFAVQFGFWPGAWYLAGLGIIYIIAGLTTFRLLRQSGAYTVGEWIEMRYGRGARQAVSLAQYIGMAFGLAANLAGLGVALTPVLGWDYGVVLAVVTVTFVAYMFAAGAWAGTVNDTIQFILGVALYVVVAIYLVASYGGTGFLAGTYNLAEQFGTYGSAPVWSLGGPPSFLYPLLGWAIFTFAAQHYFVKIAACRSERAAVHGTVWAGLFTILFAILMAVIGLYTRAVVPGDYPPVQTLGQLIAFLPPVLSTLMTVGLLAAGLSTVAGVLMASASIGARDFYQGLLKPDASPAEMLWPSRISVLVSAVIGFAAAFIPGGPAQLLAIMGAFMGITAVLFIVGAAWPRATPAAATGSAVLGILVTLLWRFALPGNLWQRVDAGYVAVVATLLALVAISYVTNPRYFGAPDWKFGRAAEDAAEERAVSHA